VLNGIPIEQVQGEAQKLDELRRELDIPPEHLVVGTVAVISRQKRLLDWLRVAHRIAAERSDVTFVIAGHGPEDEAIRREVKALDLSDRVRLLGFRPDGRRVMGILDVYLMTSEFEGLPVALLEAMALARPVVATAVGGIPEVVTSGKEGFLTDVGDVDAIATKTMQLLNDAEHRQEMGQLGANKIKKEFHTIERVKVVEGVYSDLLK
jgi:glycosyltransferase involved in cell wall biosynthesis